MDNDSSTIMHGAGDTKDRIHYFLWYCSSSRKFRDGYGLLTNLRQLFLEVETIDRKKNMKEAEKLLIKAVNEYNKMTKKNHAQHTKVKLTPELDLALFKLERELRKIAGAYIMPRKPDYNMAV